MDDQDLLAQAVVEIGHGRTKTVGELVRGWAQHVDRLNDERFEPATAPQVWGAHDLLAALHLRSMAAAALTDQTAEVRRTAGALIAGADEKFMAFTEPDLEGMLRRFAGEDRPEAEWWWHRIPKEGPVRAELLRAGG